MWQHKLGNHSLPTVRQCRHHMARALQWISHDVPWSQNGLTSSGGGIGLIPCVGRFAGDFVGSATGIMTCFAAASLSTLTIAIAWMAYRPFFSIMLLGVVGGSVYMMKKRAATARLHVRKDSNHGADNCKPHLQPSTCQRRHCLE